MRCKFLTTLSLLIVFAIANTARSEIIVPVLNSNANTNDFSTATTAKLTDNSGLSAPLNNGATLATALATTHARTGVFESWVTNASTTDYFDTGVGGASPPTFVWDLGSDKDLTDIILWNYQNEGNAAHTNVGNHAKSVDLKFNLDADGAGAFAGATTSISVNAVLGNPTPNSAQNFDLSGITARYVQMIVTDNHVGTAGVTGGGDRVGLGEVRFNDTVVPPPPPAPLEFYPISSVSTNASQFFPANNMIQGKGVGFSNDFPHNALGAGGGFTWVTDANGGDYFEPLDNAPIPEVIIDLGEDVLLTEISVWGYASTNANGVRDFNLEFATDAEGNGGFGNSITYNPAFQITTTDFLPRHGFDFSQGVTARYVKVTVTDNLAGFGQPGGDRVGIGEIAFVAIPEPSSIVLAVLGLVGGLLMIRRRK